MNETSTQAEGLLVEFCEEAMELLQEIPERLSEFSQSPSNLEPLHVVFRSVHTIKGNAGFFGLPVLKKFAHRLENSLDELREGSVDVTPELIRNLVQAIDVLSEMVTAIEEGAPDATIEPHHDELLAEIERAIADGKDASPEERLLASILEVAEEMAQFDREDVQKWADRLRSIAALVGDSREEDSRASTPSGANDDTSLKTFQDRTYRCGDVDVTKEVRELLAVFEASEAGQDPRPLGDAFLKACAELTEKASASGKEETAKQLSSVREDFSTLYSSPLDLDKNLLGVIWERLAPALTDLVDAPSSTHQDKADASTSASQASAEKKAAPKASKNRFLRVREERIDGFLEDVSSLFITIERLKDLQQRMAERLKVHDLVDELRQVNATLSSQSTALQQSVVELRRVPARELFAKFPRVARSLASKLGKQVDVHLEGEEIEIDKSLIEDLDGPLMHMVRNVCDHGIETPEEREARGVSPVGNLWLSCSLTKTHVVITVRDDGRGIDPDRLRKKAVESGWHSPEAAAALSDQEAIELIFHPGMSTAQQVTEISGRGVGLDVVRTRLREHNGDVKVESRVGEGTTFRLEIPIRRAVVVVDGLLVREGRSSFVLPFEFIREIVRIRREDVCETAGGPVVRLRGEPYAAKTLAELLGVRPQQPLWDDGCCDGVLVTHKKQTLFLMVEGVLGQRKVVVSDLASILPQCDRLSGVAQLGGGKLALVLNASELIRSACSK